MNESQPQQRRTIVSSRLLLRGAEASDATALHECFLDPELMKYWSTLPHTTMAETEKWVESMTSNVRNGVLDFLIIDKSTSKAIGKIGIWSGNEVGFMIGRLYWRKGMVSEALNAFVPMVFEQHDFESIIADADPRNEASIGILKKFGFVETGRREKTFEIGGVWMDSVDLTLSKDSWLKRQSNGS